MTTIRRTTGPMSPMQQAELQQAKQTQQAQQTVKPQLSDPGAAAAQVSQAYQAMTAGGLTPPAPPTFVMQQSLASGAEAFSAQLMDMGKNHRTSSEAMMLAFLKLQILDSSQGNKNQMLFGAGRSALFSGDLNAQKGKDERAAQASQARTRAGSLETQADSQIEQGHAIVRKEGVSTAEVEQLVEQSVKSGKNGSDVVDRYAEAHKGEPNLEAQLDALRQAQPHYQSAGAKYEESEELHEFASNISGGWMMGAATTLMTRAGTQGMTALIAAQEAQKELLNQLMALLAGIRPDAKAKDEAIVEMDKHRNQVAKLTLDFIDTHGDAKGSRLQPFQP